MIKTNNPQEYKCIIILKKIFDPLKYKMGNYIFILSICYGKIYQNENGLVQHSMDKK